MDRRYLKRMSVYWSRQYANSLRSFDRLDFASWFDLWHIHPDWKRKGNRCAEERASVARQTYMLLLHAEVLARGREIQVFATICEDTGDNAVHLHTVNPNGTPFPHEFPDAAWDASPPVELQGVVEAATHELGRIQRHGSVQYVIRRRQA